jgi:NAD-dependent deacetylase
MNVEQLIRDAKKITIISGAGLSKASGIPTFRDAGGLWDKFDPKEVSWAGADISKLGAFYTDRLFEMRDCIPNPAHFACARLEHLKDVMHVTQNVDGLLQKAGCKNVIEIHGTIYRWSCLSCGHEFDFTDLQCPSCSSKSVRPNVVLFGEMLNEENAVNGVQAVKQCDLLLLVGTSGVVQPVSLWPSYARTHRIPVIAISPDKPETHVDIWLNGKAEDILPAIVADLEIV